MEGVRRVKAVHLGTARVQGRAPCESTAVHALFISSWQNADDVIGCTYARPDFRQDDKHTLALPGVWRVLHVIQQLDEMLPGCWQNVARIQACQTAYHADCQRSHAASLVIQGHKQGLQPATLAECKSLQLFCFWFTLLRLAGKITRAVVLHA